MRLSRSRKLVLLGAALLLVGLTGRASADTTTTGRPPAAPSASAPAASASAAKSPAVKKPAAKPPAAKKPAAPKTKPGSGPAGSMMTIGGGAVALTFDDGPDPAHTPQILKMLAQQHVHATFCLVGTNVAKFPALVKQIAAGGHTLCNHTWNHSLKLGKDPADKIKADLARTSVAIHKAVPNAKIRYFRAPGGNFTPRLVGVARQLGMTSVYWKVDPRDWEHPEGETDAQHKARVIKQVERHVSKGAIVLSHDYAQPDTIAAYRTLLPWLHKRYKLVGLPT